MRLKRSQSFIIAGGVLVLFFAASIGFMNTKKSPPTVQEAEAAEKAARQESPNSDAPEEESVGSASTFVLDKFHRSETKNGRIVWEIKAERGKYFPESSSAKIEDATLWFFKEDGQTAILEANKADVLLDGPSIKRADAKDGVVLKLEDKATITTDEASYFHQEATVKAPGKVNIESDFINTTGVGLEGNIETKEFTLFKNVESVIKPFKKKKS